MSRFFARIEGRGFGCRGVVDPAGKENPLPFESKAANGLVVAFSFGNLGFVVLAGPGAEAGGLDGMFVKALAQEVRASDTLAVVISFCRCRSRRSLGGTA